MKKLMSFCLILATFSLSAQIENEIRSYVDSSEIIIRNGRRYLEKNLMDRNFSKATEVYNFLADKTENKIYLAFSYDEDLGLNLLLKNFSDLSNKAINYSQYFPKYTHNPEINLYPAIQEQLVKQEKEVSSAIAQSGLSDEDKDMLYIFLYLVVADKADDMYYSQMKEFHKKYPQTKYFDFINNYLPRVRARVSSAYGFGVSGVFPTGKLGEGFKSNVNFNLCWDFNIGKVYSSLYMQAGALKVKTPFSVNNSVQTITFDEDENFTYLDAGVLVGYFAVRNEHIHVAPFGAIMGTSLTSNMYDNPDDEKYELDIISSFTAGLGLKTEIKLFDYEMHNFYGNGYGQKSYVSLKFEGGYNVIAKTEFDEFDGDVAYVRATLMWGFGSF
ncbi:MAG: hypothetical protein A2W95_13450 [Bacteroidetes bacterium GWA2_40_14]|nr:MAG: hypothetical protein A2W95_13450 [Bacteroidetes bacterium GWA2_40_14]HAZ04979.1 hypothetical protein [Marinilabiliales bacterium]